MEWLLNKPSTTIINESISFENANTIYNTEILTLLIEFYHLSNEKLKLDIIKDLYNIIILNENNI